MPNPDISYTDEANVAKADFIFTAHVTRTEEVPVAGAENKVVVDGVFDRGWVDVTYQLIEPIKGDVPDRGVVATVFTDCNGTILPGGDYIFFVDSNEEKKRLEVSGVLSGTRMIWKQSDQSKQYIETIKNLVTRKKDSHS
ncbi:MAG: hypothetical protein QM719_03040 [Thermomonas sp.]